MISIPRLTWSEVAAHQLPVLDELMTHASVGDLSLRTIGPRTTLAKAYLSIGTGNRASVNDPDGGKALAPADLVEVGTAAESYRRRTGLDGSGAAVLQLSIATIDYQTEHGSYDARPGALAEALGDHGWTNAVVANADEALLAGPDTSMVGGLGTVPPTTTTPTQPVGGENRPAALSVMDHNGQVAKGVVGPQLLRPDARAAYGLRQNISRTVATVRRVWTDKTLALVELSDLDRADRYGGSTSPAERVAITTQALHDTNAALGKLLAQVDPTRDLVYVLSPAAPRSGETLTPMVMWGPGFTAGTLRSGTTRRTGYVTLSDVAPSILERLGITKPSTMTGAPISISTAAATSTSRGRWTRFLAWNDATAFSTTVASSIGVWFESLQVIGYLLLIAALARWRQAKPLVGFLALVAIAVVPLTFVSGYFRYQKLGQVPYQAALAAGAVALAAVAHYVGRRLAGDHQQRRALIPPLLLVALVWVGQIVDICFDGKAQINTVFGYSPIVAGRFSGYGNTAFAFLGIAAVVLVGGGWALFVGDSTEPRRRLVLLAGAAVIFGVTIVADGYPTLGSDVGGVIALIPMAVLVLLLLAGRRINLRTLAVIGAITIVALGSFAAIDLARPADQQTHLARLVHDTFGSGGAAPAPVKSAKQALDTGKAASGSFTTLRRKLDANLGSIGGSSFSTFFFIALGFLALVAWKGRDRVRTLTRSVPGMRACLWGALVVAVLGDLANDSGITVPAMMFPILLSYLIYLVVTLDLPGPEVAARSKVAADPEALATNAV